MRQITDIIVHCSATPEGRDFTVKDIDRWHRERGYRAIGYHYVIYRDGSVHKGRADSECGAHCQGHNAHSIGVCYIGGTDKSGKPKDTRTAAQKEALLTLLKQLKKQYPKATIHGHRYYNPNKACPSFDAGLEYQGI